MIVGIILIVLYLGLLAGNYLGMTMTSFIRSKGLWNLVPFRVGGWHSRIDPHKVYKINWPWQKLDFGNFYIEKEK